MARGLYAKLHCRVWDGERIRQLTTGEQLAYLYLWTAAVDCRSSTIPPELASPSAVAEGMHRRPQSVKKWLDALCGKLPSEQGADNESVNDNVNESVYDSVDGFVIGKRTKASYTPRRKRHTEPLVTRHPDGSITVHHIKEIHPKLHWDKEYTPVYHTVKEDCPNGKNTKLPKRLHQERGKGEGREEESLGTPISTSSLLSPTPDQNPEVSQKGEQEPSRKEVTTIEQFQAARPSGPEEIHRLAFEVIDSLNLPDQIAAEVEGIVSGYPVAWTRDCIQTTRDKQLRIAEGTDKTGFTAGPLNYLAGALSRKYEQLRQGKG